MHHLYGKVDTLVFNVRIFVVDVDVLDIELNPKRKTSEYSAEWRMIENVHLHL
jgi:hypothetical protein